MLEDAPTILNAQIVALVFLTHEEVFGEKFTREIEDSLGSMIC